MNSRVRLKRKFRLQAIHTALENSRNGTELVVMDEMLACV